MPSALGKDINIPLFGEHERSVDRAHVIHFHGSLLAVLFKPSRKHKVLYALAVTYVIVVLNRIADFEGVQPNTFPAMKPELSYRIQVYVDIGNHLQHLVG